MATVTAPWWLWWVLGGLDAAGFTVVCWVATRWAERLTDWLRRDRVAPLLEDALCPGCLDQRHCDGVMPNCNCTCTWPEDWAEQPLPPERTWEQMTSHQLPVVGMSPREQKDWEHREGVRRRGARRVEMMHRAHYAALGLEYPSGLLARVREAAQ